MGGGTQRGECEVGGGGGRGGGVKGGGQAIRQKSASNISAPGKPHVNYHATIGFGYHILTQR